MCGAMADNIKEIGLIIKCMEMDSINGKMAECMPANINLIKSTASVFILGQMGASMQENGLIVNEVVEVRSFLLTGLKDKDNGRKIRGFDGLTNPKKCVIPKTQKNIDL